MKPNTENLQRLYDEGKLGFEYTADYIEREYFTRVVKISTGWHLLALTFNSYKSVFLIGCIAN